MAYVPIICPLCKQNTFRVNERKNRKDIINPFYLQYNNKSCKKKGNLRNYSFLKFSKKIPASITYEIINLFAIDNQNAKKNREIIKIEISKNT